MKKVLSTLALLLILILLGGFFAAGRIVDGQRNVLIGKDFETPETEIQKFHDSLTIADWHADNLLWDRNPLTRLEHGHVDIPRLIEGNFTLQVFDAVIKSPRGQNYYSNTGDTDNITLLAIVNRWPYRTWNSLFERAIHQAEKLHRAEAESEGTLKIIRNARELNELLTARKDNKNMLGGILGIEGLHALEGNFDNLEKLFVAGYRVMGLTHFFDNEVGGSSAGMVQGGLTEFGKRVIKSMNDQNIIIDLAHASSALIDDVLDYSTKPVIVSHTGVRKTFDSPRNLSDQEIRAIAKKGGVIGIGFWDGAVGSIRPEDIVRAMRHVKNLVGIDFVCLGSDWDGSTQIFFDASNIIVLTKALLDDGFSRQEIRQIMGENQIRFLMDNLPRG